MGEENDPLFGSLSGQTNVTVQENENSSSDSSNATPPPPGGLFEVPRPSEIELVEQTFGSGGSGDPAEVEFVEAQRDFVIDGVPWASEGYYHRKRFAENFRDALRNVCIAGSDKLLIMERFVDLAYTYKRLGTKWKWISHTGRVIVTVGSIIVPALITLDDEIRERSSVSQALAYTVFGVSLLVSIVNGLQEYFAATSRYITVGTTSEALESEGWAFLALSGRYSKFETHDECVSYFLSRVDKIHSAAVNATMALARKPADDNGHTNKSSRLQQQPGGGMASSEGPLSSSFDEDSAPPVVYANH